MFLLKAATISLVSLTASVVTIARDDISLNRFTKLSGEAASDLAATAVASGDFNGDGKSDLLVGAPNQDGNGNDAGAAYIIYGASTLNSVNLSSANVKFIGESAGDLAGYAVASAGDVNADGKDDILIGAYGANSNAGAAYLIYGSSALTGSFNLSTASTKFIGEAGGDKAGFSVASAGDVNADGKDDMLIGAYGANSSTGAAYLVYSSASLSSAINLSSANVKFSGETSGDQAGFSVTSAGDVNGDNNADILIGAPNRNSAAGMAYLIYGSGSLNATFSLAMANVQFIGVTSSDSAGVAVSSAGDVNADGKADLLIGASGNDTGGNNAGAAYLIYGASTLSSSINLTAANVTLLGEEGNNAAGGAVASAGDVNHDGKNDILVGAMLYDGGSSQVGAAYLVYGATSLSSSIDLANANGRFTGEAVGDQAGIAVASAGDINGDGWAEVFIGANKTSATGTNSGAAYLGILYVDTDQDGVASGGLIGGTDCNDADSTVSSNQTYYQDSDGDGLGTAGTTTSVCSATPPAGYVVNQSDTNDTVANNGVEISGDGIDNDGDGSIDEVNTVADNQFHPEYSDDAPSSGAGVLSVVGIANGSIEITYADNSVYRYAIFSVNTDALTLVERHTDTGYVAVTHPYGTKLSLVNAYNGTVLSRRLLSTKRRYSAVGVQIFTVRQQPIVVITNKRKRNVQLSIVPLVLEEAKLGKVAQQLEKNKAVDVDHTGKKKKLILLRNASDAVLSRYRVTKTFQLKKI